MAKLKQSNWTITLDLKTEKLVFKDSLLSAQFTVNKGKKPSALTFTISDPGLKIANKLQERSQAEGGILAPAELLVDPDKPSTVTGLENVSSNLVGEDLYKTLIAYCKTNGVTSLYHQAYVLATVKHESNGGLFLKELGENSRFTMLYEGRADLGNTQSGDGVKYAGRGYVQITGRTNYTKFGKLLGIDLVNKPEQAEQPRYAIPICVLGMRDGLFTAFKLSDFDTASGYNFAAARNIINGIDRAELIADYACQFLIELQQGKYKTVGAISSDVSVTIAPTAASSGSSNQLRSGFSNLVDRLNVNTTQLTSESEKVLAEQVLPGYKITLELETAEGVKSVFDFFYLGYETSDYILKIKAGNIGSVLSKINTNKLTQTYENTSVSQLAYTIGAQYGLKVELPLLPMLEKITTVTQYKGESLLDVLEKLGLQQGFYFQVLGDTLKVFPFASDTKQFILSDFITYPSFSDLAEEKRIIKNGLPPLVQKGSDYEKQLSEGKEIGEGFTGECSVLTSTQLFKAQPEDLIIFPTGTLGLKGLTALIRAYRIKSITHSFPGEKTLISFYLPVWVTPTQKVNASSDTNLLINKGGIIGDYSLPGLEGKFTNKTPITVNGVFTWGEATRNGERIPSDPEIITNITRLAVELEKFRANINKTLNITSWYRDPASNAAASGASKSQHLTGKAVDFWVEGETGATLKQKALTFGWRGGIGSYPAPRQDICHVDIGDPRTW